MLPDTLKILPQTHISKMFMVNYGCVKRHSTLYLITVKSIRKDITIRNIKVVNKRVLKRRSQRKKRNQRKRKSQRRRRKKKRKKKMMNQNQKRKKRILLIYYQHHHLIYSISRHYLWMLQIRKMLFKLCLKSLILKDIQFTKFNILKVKEKAKNYS